MSFKRKLKQNAKWILLVVAVIIAGIFIDVVEPTYGFFGRVPTGSVGILTRFGKIKDDSIGEGLHLKGFFDRITSMSTRTQKYQASLSAFSKDIQQVDLQIVVNYNVDKSTAVMLFKRVGSDYDDKLIAPAIIEQTKVVISRYTAEGLVANREELSNGIYVLLKNELESSGITVTMVAVEDIDFTDAFTNAVEQKQVATQNKLTAQTEQERLTAETEAKAKREKIEAEADAEVARTKADAEAYATRVKAEAEAEANLKLSQSITKDLINYLYAINWDGVLPTMMIGEGSSVIPVVSGDGN